MSGLRLERWVCAALERRRDMLRRARRHRAPWPSQYRGRDAGPGIVAHAASRSAEIAARLTVSPNTSPRTSAPLHRKLGASSRSSTVRRAVDLGLLASRRRSPATERPRRLFASRAAPLRHR